MTLSLREPRQLGDLLNFRLLRLFAVSGAPVSGDTVFRLSMPNQQRMDSGTSENSQQKPPPSQPSAFFNRASAH